MSTIIHIPGSGDARNDSNIISQARLRKVLDLFSDGSEPDQIWLYGRQQPGMSLSEAQSAADFLRANGVPETLLHLDEEVKSTSETLQKIAQKMRDDAADDVMSVHIVITNWPFVPRSKYLLRKQWQRLSEMPWSRIERFVLFPGNVDAGLTLRSLPWWLYHVALRSASRGARRWLTRSTKS